MKRVVHILVTLYRYFMDIFPFILWWRTPESYNLCIVNPSERSCCWMEAFIWTRVSAFWIAKCHHSGRPHCRHLDALFCARLAHCSPAGLGPALECLIQIWGHVNEEKSLPLSAEACGLFCSRKTNKQVALCSPQGPMIFLKKKEKPQRQLLDAGADDHLGTLRGCPSISNVWCHLGVWQKLLEARQRIFISWKYFF